MDVRRKAGDCMVCAELLLPVSPPPPYTAFMSPPWRVFRPMGFPLALFGNSVVLPMGWGQ